MSACKYSIKKIESISNGKSLVISVISVLLVVLKVSPKKKQSKFSKRNEVATK